MEAAMARTTNAASADGRAVSSTAQGDDPRASRRRRSEPGDPIERLARLLKRLCRHLSQAEELADAMAFELQAVKRALEADASGRLSAVADEAVRHARPTKVHRHAASLRVAAEDGARLDFRTRARGDAMVRVDDGKWFELPPTLARLLWVLAYGAAAGTDGFPAWQTFETVADQLARKAGRKPTRRAITQAVYRLRGVMAESAVNPFLLQVDRQRGLRFLLAS